MIFAALHKLVAGEERPTLSSRRLHDRRLALEAVRQEGEARLAKEQRELERRMFDAKRVIAASFASAEEAMRVALEKGRAAIGLDVDGVRSLVAAYLAAPSPAAARAIGNAWLDLEQRATEELGETLLVDQLVYAFADAAGGNVDAIAWAPLYKHADAAPPWRDKLAAQLQALRAAFRAPGDRKLATEVEAMAAEVEALPATLPPRSMLLPFLADLRAAVTVQHLGELDAARAAEKAAMKNALHAADIAAAEVARERRARGAPPRMASGAEVAAAAERANDEATARWRAERRAARPAGDGTPVYAPQGEGSEP